MRLPYVTKAHWLSVGLLGAMLCIGYLGGHSRTAADTPAPPVSCTTLTARLSDDKNFYIFTATTTGDSDAITGYTFDFGDRQSYQFTFSPTDHGDRHTTTVTHTYRSPGTYASTVHVNIKAHNETAAVTSDTCKTSTAILPPGSALPNTGARNILGLCVAAALTAAPLHSLWIRRHSTTPKTPPKSRTKREFHTDS